MTEPTRRRRWGAILRGEPTELESWKNHLKEPFDPWLEVHGDDTALCSQWFDESSAAEEVRERALMRIQQLNGAVALYERATSVQLGGLIEFGPDGRRHNTIIFAEMRAFEIGDTAQMAFEVSASDGKPVRLRPSQVQDCVKLTDDDDLLRDALIYFGSATNWFDIYKVLECLISRFGGEKNFLALEWVPRAEVELLKNTANTIFRHARHKYDPPKEPMSLEHARELIAALLRRAGAEASHRRDPDNHRDTDL
jgi:hypothetical protein